jgi:SAM-dependent methyltransferase
MFKITRPRRSQVVFFGFLTILTLLLPTLHSTETATYSYGPASSDGTGKYYLGREISQVMGHRGADWLERPERELEERPSILIESLGLKPGQVVADIGAGTGYFTWRLAEAVGQDGLVWAVDIQPEMLKKLARNMRNRDLRNYRPVQGSARDPKIPELTLDLALMVDVYHEFSHPAEMLEALGRALKPGGRLAFVEYREEDPSVPIKRLHKMSEKQVRKEAETSRLEYVETISVLPRQHIIIFRRPLSEPVTDS